MGIFDFLNKIPTVNEIVGGFGEWMTKIYSTTLPGALVLRDVLINGAEGYTSQIDVLIVGNKGIYVIEVKTYTDAKIYGDVKKSKWYYYNHGKKYEIYSPIRQNQKHVEYLKEFLKDFGDIPYFSGVTVICDDFKVSGIFEPNTFICNSFPAMERAIYKITENSPYVMDDEKKQAIFDYIKNNQHTGKEMRQKHKENVIAYKDELEKLKDQKICPYCKGELVLRNGKNGEFYGCSNFPKCRYTSKV